MKQIKLSIKYTSIGTMCSKRSYKVVTVETSVPFCNHSLTGFLLFIVTEC